MNTVVKPNSLSPASGGSGMLHTDAMMMTTTTIIESAKVEEVIRGMGGL